MSADSSFSFEGRVTFSGNLEDVFRRMDATSRKEQSIQLAFNEEIQKRVLNLLFNDYEDGCYVALSDLDSRFPSPVTAARRTLAMMADPAAQERILELEKTVARLSASVEELRKDPSAERQYF